MSPTARLTLLLSTLSTVALAGCGPMDDEACLYEDGDVECPSAEDAADRLIGNQTCESPVRKITRTGELVSEEFQEGHEGTYGYVDARTQCCYEAAYRELKGQSCVVGRPIRDQGEPVTAPTVPAVPLVAFLADAHLEHASVAAFAKLTLDLLSLGAPADLVQRATAAQADEVRHARQCFELASQAAGQPLRPGPLPLPQLGTVDLVQLAVESFEEGCVGETLAVCQAALQLQRATDPTTRAVLQGIVEDETRHAQLGWDIVRWAIAEGGAPVAEAVANAMSRLDRPTGGLFEAAHDQVIGPTIAELLAA